MRKMRVFKFRGKMKPCKICKNEAIIGEYSYGFYYICLTKNCCAGPACKTKEEAEAAWDELMGDADPEPRRPVGISDIERTITVVCDDGSVFGWAGKEVGWDPIPPIPGTPADRSEDE